MPRYLRYRYFVHAHAQRRRIDTASFLSFRRVVIDTAQRSINVIQPTQFAGDICPESPQSPADARN